MKYAVFALTVFMAASALSWMPKENERAPSYDANDNLMAMAALNFREYEIDMFSQQIAEGYNINEQRSRRFAKWILTASDSEGVPASLLAAVIMTESSFRENIVNKHSGATGPGQLKPKFWESWCQLDLNDPKLNILCSAKVLNHYKKSCEGNWVCALSKYNVGPSNLHRSVKMQDAARRYVKKVTIRIEELGVESVEKFI